MGQVSLTDPNNNSISLTYDGSGKPVTLTDTSGRTVTLVYDGAGLIGSMSDSLGTIATYTHSFWGRLTQVAYPDGSQFNFSDAFNGSSFLVTSVSDALGNVLDVQHQHR